MTKKLSLLVMMLLFIGSTGFANQPAASEVRTVKKFDQVSGSCGIDVCINAGTSNQITVEVNKEGALERVKTEVNKGVLEISIDDKGWKRPKGLKVKVTLSADRLKGIKASSGSDVYTTHVLEADAFSASASSGSDIKLKIRANSLSLSASSGADLVVEGTATSVKAHASSGSDIKARKLIAEKVSASASSGSDIVVHAEKELKARASSGADIKYSGNPADKDISKSSGGSVKQL